MQELREIRAIALFALHQAARHGEYRASFRGFRVQALRQCAAPEVDALVAVDLCVSVGNTVLERSLVATTDAGAREPMP